MWYGLLIPIAMVIGVFAGALGNIPWFAVSALLFVASVLIAKIEEKDELTWGFCISLALIWLGVMGGLSWPFMRWTLPGLGLVVAAIVWLCELRSKKKKIQQS